MFDIGFSEIVVIGVVALVVIGPERLPKTARTLGHLFGRLQRYVNEVKADINREMELDELRRLRQEVQTAATDLTHSVTRMATEVESGVRSVEQQLNDAGREATGSSATAGPAAAAGASMTPTEQGAPAPVASAASGPPPAPAALPAPDAPAAPAAPPERQSSLPGFDHI